VGDLLSDQFAERYAALKLKHEGMLASFGDDLPMPFNLAEAEAEWLDAVAFMKGLRLIDSEHFLNQALAEGKRILAEGAQGTMLDIDFGTYPFVTSSNTVTAGACTGLGIAPNRIGEVIGIFKAYCTRVGSGPFPTELDNELGESLRQAGGEFGATTGRPRRTGWLDLPQLKYAAMINGATQLAMMKSDVLSAFDTIQVCTHYLHKGERIDYLPFGINPDEVTPIYAEHPGWTEDLTGVTEEADLPQSLKDYTAMIERETGIPVRILSVGPDRKQTILRESVSRVNC
jgi:adenylosuccinate synthase